MKEYYYAAALVSSKLSRFIYEPLDTNIAPSREGRPFVRVTTTGGAVITLDGMRLKNVVFDGATIEYQGGPLAMENTYFVNCRFEVKPAIGKPTKSLELFTKAVLNKVPASVLVS